MVKIDFKVLDNVSVQPVGVYGSRSEIVTFLERFGGVQIATYVLLLSRVDRIIKFSR
jgi:hypothetical protein